MFLHGCGRGFAPQIDNMSEKLICKLALYAADFAFLPYDQTQNPRFSIAFIG